MAANIVANASPSGSPGISRWAAMAAHLICRPVEMFELVAQVVAFGKALTPLNDCTALLQNALGRCQRDRQRDHTSWKRRSHGRRATA
jgi:hypothetical protein